MTSADKFSDFLTLPQLSKRIQWYLSTLFSLEIPPTPIRKSKNRPNSQLFLGQIHLIFTVKFGIHKLERFFKRSSSHQTGQFGGFHAGVGLWLRLEARWGRPLTIGAPCVKFYRYWAQGDPKVDIRQPRGRLDLEVDKQWLRIAEVIHYCQWMSEMVLSRPPKGQESQIMTKCELKGHII